MGIVPWNLAVCRTEAEGLWNFQNIMVVHRKAVFEYQKAVMVSVGIALGMSSVNIFCQSLNGEHHRRQGQEEPGWIGLWYRELEEVTTVTSQILNLHWNHENRGVDWRHEISRERRKEVNEDKAHPRVTMSLVEPRPTRHFEFKWTQGPNTLQITKLEGQAREVKWVGFI
jgi:hypothetical protein